MLFKDYLILSLCLTPACVSSLAPIWNVTRSPLQSLPAATILAAAVSSPHGQRRRSLYATNPHCKGGEIPRPLRTLYALDQSSTARSSPSISCIVNQEILQQPTSYNQLPNALAILFCNGGGIPIAVTVSDHSVDAVDMAERTLFSLQPPTLPLDPPLKRRLSPTPVQLFRSISTSSRQPLSLPLR